MKRSGIPRLQLLALLLLGLAAPAAGQHESPSAGAKPASLLPGLGTHHHPVATRDPQAQRFFDQGLRLVYAFNHEEAIRSFQRAAELDPQLAMAYWGIALANGPNINMPMDPAHHMAAYEAIRKASSLAPDIPENERAYIEALARRYSNDPKANPAKLALAYREAMGDLVKRYPDDLDAATLYADSIMNLRPWKLWTPGGKPAEGTEEIVAVLEAALRREPDHVGANHFYVHALEGSPHPEYALPSAR